MQILSLPDTRTLEMKSILHLANSFLHSNSKVEPDILFLASSFSSLIRPLKLRVEQSLVLQSDPILVYQLIELLSFYRNNMEGSLGAQSELVAMMIEYVSRALKAFNY